jgi:hypothetical protein
VTQFDSQDQHSGVPVSTACTQCPKTVSDSDLKNLSSVLSAFDDGLLLGHLVRSGRWMWLDNGVLIRRKGAK